MHAFPSHTHTVTDQTLSLLGLVIRLVTCFFAGLFGPGGFSLNVLNVGQYCLAVMGVAYKCFTNDKIKIPEGICDLSVGSFWL